MRRVHAWFWRTEQTSGTGHGQGKEPTTNP
jgi:hypothetical protein